MSIHLPALPGSFVLRRRRSSAASLLQKMRLYPHLLLGLLIMFAGTACITCERRVEHVTEYVLEYDPEERADAAEEGTGQLELRDDELLETTRTYLAALLVQDVDTLLRMLPESVHEEAIANVRNDAAYLRRIGEFLPPEGEWNFRGPPMRGEGSTEELGDLALAEFEVEMPEAPAGHRFSMQVAKDQQGRLFITRCDPIDYVNENALHFARAVERRDLEAVPRYVHPVLLAVVDEEFGGVGSWVELINEFADARLGSGAWRVHDATWPQDGHVQGEPRQLRTVSLQRGEGGQIMYTQSALEPDHGYLISFIEFRDAE